MTTRRQRPTATVASNETTIRGNCPSCGDVQLKASELTVRVCSDDERGSYCFRCPDCRKCVAKDASRRIVDLLVSSGCRMQVWRLPAELKEEHVGPPFVPDDLLDFHWLLFPNGKESGTDPAKWANDWFPTLYERVAYGL